MSKVLVFGASGQLGTCLKSLALKQGFDHMVFPEEDPGPGRPECSF
jgi:dTDP-4-dehydrorhamnose reductase